MPGTPVSAYAVVGKFGDIHTSARNSIGARYQDELGNEYVYLLGVAATVTNDAVTYNASTYQSVRAVSTTPGFVALAGAAVLATQFGWYQIYGFGSVNTKTSIAAAGGGFLTTTAGQLDDASIAGQYLLGFLFTGVDVALVAPCHLAYPVATNTVPA